MTKSEILLEAKDVLGFVPDFIEDAPEQEITPMWGLFKDLVLADTAIPMKYKTLIEIAVGAVLHDRYRIQLSTEMARGMDVTEGEIREAITIAEMTSFGSTWMNGYQFDFEHYKKEFRKMLDKAQELVVLPPRRELETKEDVYADIEGIFGFVPEFIKEIPDMALKHFWNIIRRVYLEETIIPNRFKELIGLAVASAINCRYCTFFHTESAKLNGASDDEIKEAVLLAARIRAWGVMMYGTQYDLETAKKEFRKLVESVKKRVAAGVR